MTTRSKLGQYRETTYDDFCSFQTYTQTVFEIQKSLLMNRWPSTIAFSIYITHLINSIQNHCAVACENVELHHSVMGWCRASASTTQHHSIIDLELCLDPFLLSPRLLADESGLTCLWPFIIPEDVHIPLSYRLVSPKLNERTYLNGTYCGQSKRDNMQNNK